VAYSFVRYTADGITSNYTFSFSYLDQTHIKVSVDGVNTDLFNYLNSSTIHFLSVPTAGAVIQIRRITPKDTPVVNFQDGSVLLERDLDLLAMFDLYVAQEASDAVADTISTDSTGRWDSQLKRLGNLSPALNDDEAVTKGTLVYDYPAVAAVASNVAAVNIVASDLGVATATSADLGFITDSAGTTPGAGTSKIVAVADNLAAIQSVAANIVAVQSAVVSAASAETSAASASTSATSATASQTAAASSETAALASKNAAATSATGAATSASAAATSLASAVSQANAAGTSATGAALSASGAGSSATNAASSASSAATSATAAASSASSAATSATSASGSASTATSQAAAASTSASTASSAQSAVATSATNAANSATAAAGSATTASTAATTATTQATNAASSAAAASTSATSASSSASAASVSATDAAASAASAAALLDNFDDRYLGPKASAPTLDNDGNALIVGALYFDTTSGKMRVYTASGWLDASAASTAALTKYKFIATAGQTTFSGTDVNGLTLGYLAGGEVVSLNGLVLVGGTDDYTGTTGSSIVLVSGAVAGDTLEVYAFSSFSIASVDGSAITNGTITVDKFALTLDLGVLP